MMTTPFRSPGFHIFLALLCASLCAVADEPTPRDLAHAGTLVNSYLAPGATALQRKRYLLRMEALGLPHESWVEVISKPPTFAKASSSQNLKLTFKHLKQRSTESYVLQIPRSYDPATPSPLVVALHGTWGSAARYAQYCKSYLDAGYVIAAPQANRDHGLGASTYSYELTLELLADVARRVNIDHDRVYAVGLSMGAHFAYILGCHLSDRFAAVCPHAGASHRLAAYKYMENFLHVGVYAINGTRDGLVRIDYARKGPKRLKELGYDIIFRELNTGHMHYASEDGKVREFFKKKKRPRYPKRVIKVVRRKAYTRAYWLRIDTLKTQKQVISKQIKSPRGKFLEMQKLNNPESRVEGTIDKAKNTITLKSKEVTAITVYLNDRMVDLDQPVKILLNGRRVHSRKVTRSLETMLDICVERRARDLLFWNAVKVRP